MNPSNQSSAKNLNLRAQVIKTLLAVQNGQSLSSVLNQHINMVSERDRGLYHELTLGCLRQWYSLKAITLPLLTKPLDNEALESCLYLGLYQILCTRIPVHAAISETVNAAKQLGFEPMSGLVNAILRRVSRETDEFETALNNTHGLPSWLFKRLKKDWPEQVEPLCQALKQVAPLTLRVNERQVSRDEYLDILDEEQIDARECEFSDVGIVLRQTGNITLLPGFEAGGFSVQDEHAQLCATLLPDLDGKVVVDACAAPGGKTAHILERFNPKKLIAIDQDPKRIVRIGENLERLALNLDNVEILVADATTWQAQEPVDCIVLDAPCSATGVIRRHPDIRLLRQSTDIAQTVALQQQILQQMWQQLKVGGTLLYITCSILKTENEHQMVKFFAEHPNAKEIKITADWGIEQMHGRQLLPSDQSGDGFYYCRIQKIA
ncbi:Ribosomal RNA small subunit methyltransferase B [Acinetobacter haemolyticus CIP 64.3 = MTCC 9819]|uniref:16S rRNA (cytosine(967)-C(5))-methyltransferase n=2 Tax=Acinetobacter haemolyticus TaxID=29430 RepID=A0AAW4JHC3_ACIHA|nr:16S rRNA (cytosine(967)-C(5))-methyltransferase RsmB [Acinetobacter haemolyticus]ENW20485.1 ribosomal RNA small subunit methyltransferase B [Acinetobacter haemolyticus CIP 64.3 = MTCC 9819]EPR89345.1 Ribosomal RNA small subunit methyltransferase B [Acinetobacter haemolyticus CIP 64.3 = MTCC 9819]MBO3659160.1 16S rRNA (cytosine(967)-C(5))-methyltransferase RsmB [Acinetobacter haemolyticus]NAR99343.1 16S rRNA (cytosine(967)-C(5))-methyltransferase RsmB [Acinetobacter haemolyticus]QXZ27577.1 1